METKRLLSLDAFRGFTIAAMILVAYWLMFWLSFSMAYGLLLVGINFIPAYILYKRKIFIKL